MRKAYRTLKGLPGQYGVGYIVYPTDCASGAIGPHGENFWTMTGDPHGNPSMIYTNFLIRTIDLERAPSFDWIDPKADMKEKEALCNNQVALQNQLNEELINTVKKSVDKAISDWEIGNFSNPTEPSRSRFIAKTLIETGLVGWPQDIPEKKEPVIQMTRRYGNVLVSANIEAIISGGWLQNHDGRVAKFGSGTLQAYNAWCEERIKEWKLDELRPPRNLGRY